MHATAFLKSPDQVEVQPVTVIYGPQRYLQCASMAAIAQRVLGGAEDAEFGPVRFDGKAVDPKTVFDELRTVSMWGDKRIVIVDDADEFVTRNRAGLEAYVELPARKSVLVLVVRSWPKNTKLAKKVDATGLALECADLSGAALIRWLSEICRDQYAKQLERNAAELLIERAGAELGLLSQEVEKLAAFVGNRERITSADVDTLVGGWRAEATWTMVARSATQNWVRRWNIWTNFWQPARRRSASWGACNSSSASWRKPRKLQRAASRFRPRSRRRASFHATSIRPPAICGGSDVRARNNCPQCCWPPMPT